MKQTQIQKTKTDKAEPEIDNPPEPVNETALDASTADVLDELDEILNELGEDFALKYVQRGGE